MTLRTGRLLPPKGPSTLGFDAGRFPPTPPACYPAPWRLPGPDFHRLADASLSSDQVIVMAPPPNSGHTNQSSRQKCCSSADARPDVNEMRDLEILPECYRRSEDSLVEPAAHWGVLRSHASRRIAVRRAGASRCPDLLTGRRDCMPLRTAAGPRRACSGRPGVARSRPAYRAAARRRRFCRGRG